MKYVYKDIWFKFFIQLHNCIFKTGKK